MRETEPAVSAGQFGRRRVVERQQPRKSKRSVPQHADKYADVRQDPAQRDMSERLRALADHFNGEEADRG